MHRFWDMIFLSFELLLHRKVSYTKMDISNKNVKNKLGIIFTLDYRQLLTKTSFFEIQKKKSGDIGKDFAF
jgi:hypothetical protein